MLEQLSVIKLGANWLEKVKIIVLYSYLKLKRIFWSKNGLRELYRMKLSFQNREFDFYIKYILDFHLLREIFIDQHYAACKQCIPAPKVILDLGSNIGATAIYFKTLFPQVKVYCFEPNPQCFLSLEKNIVQFDGTVETVPIAVAGSDGKQLFYFNQEHWSASLYDRTRAGQEIEVETKSLDGIISDIGEQGPIGLLKFDIEGAEYEVFDQARDLSRVEKMVGEIHPTITGKSKEDFLKLISGFRVTSLTKVGSHYHVFFERLGKS